MKELGLYIHMPFCLRKCHYCDFASFAGEEGRIKNYVDGLIVESGAWKQKLEGYKIKSIFIGGGTPTIVPIGEMNRLLEQLYKIFSIKKEIEFSIEGNPGTFDKEKLDFYRASGVNRMSIGFQAWQEELLAVLGRVHDQRQFVENYFLAREAGINNINVDLMFGLPGQTMDHWQETLQRIVELEPDHISAYSLKVEEGTKFGILYDKGMLSLPTEELDRAMYDYAIEFLKTNKYGHYEISNFAQKGKECIHNKIYWNNEEYIGLGLNAHSYFNKYRFSNIGNLDGYIQKTEIGGDVIIENIPVSLADEMAETMFLGLRMTVGVSIQKFQQRFGISPIVQYEKKIRKMISLGLIEVNEKSVRLSRKGIDLSNQVFMEFLPD
ncbi:oxygen-independent coproporphyrinogen-3 oxidase [Anaerosolibacter carboniphilus]|uniref:Heme chaperone HemW n=1 Tax=Anaerosolibacter carboniphilus TaxID=1417629 RepID=A0A841KWX0_9FIRM|nr:radical SAM family heme chaperone HemW [Anaerosolibacter carboniphilus]MBB6217941.1 oxygen-independent coproporphyrinogen-3 oxidase [Anaerosolibacter carboniphilus]